MIGISWLRSFGLRSRTMTQPSWTHTRPRLEQLEDRTLLSTLQAISKNNLFLHDRVAGTPPLVSHQPGGVVWPSTLLPWGSRSNPETVP